MEVEIEAGNDGEFVGGEGPGTSLSWEWLAVGLSVHVDEFVGARIRSLTGCSWLHASGSLKVAIQPTSLSVGTDASEFPVDDREQVALVADRRRLTIGSRREEADGGIFGDGAEKPFP